MTESTERKRHLAALFSIVVIDLIGFGIVVPVLPFYVTEFGANATVLGLLVGCYAAMQFLFAPLWGRLSDRIGRRRVMLVTIAGTSAALLLLGLANSLLWLFVARLLGGMFAANISVASAYITDVTDESERTRWMGVLGACFAVGFLLGPAVGGLLGQYGHSLPMLVASGLAAANFCYAVFVLKEPDVHRSGDVSLDRKAVLADPRVRRICLANLLFSLAVTQLETVFAFLMMMRFDYDVLDTALILVLMAVVMGLIQGGAMRVLAARFGERNLLTAGLALMAVAFVAVPMAQEVKLLLVPLIVSAVGRGIGQPAMMSMVSSYATENTRGAVMGSFSSRASLARALGPAPAGLLFDQWIAAPFLLAAGLLVATLVLCVRLPARVGGVSDGASPEQTGEAVSTPSA
jgi:DHA1 family tetracycline resistance protein-like MFS transporter